MIKKQIYLSIDIEADGKIPIKNSMLSFGVAAFDEKGEKVDTYEANLELLPGAVQDKDTMDWWEKRWDIYEITRENLVSVEQGMTDYYNWQIALKEKYEERDDEGEKTINVKLAYLGYPLAYDFMFVYIYTCMVNGNDNAGFSGFDIKTAAAVLLKRHYSSAHKSNFPKKWFPKTKHTHIALDDAIEQGYIAMNIMKEAGIIK